MRDPELMFRAQVAASALERAWEHWRTVHGQVADPMPTVSSYVGYSLDEPWGEPRVVFGLAAEDAEQLVLLLERHDCVGPVHAMVRRPAMREVPGEQEPLLGPEAAVPLLPPFPIPAQPSGATAEQRARLWRPPQDDEVPSAEIREDASADSERLPAFHDAPWARPHFLDDDEPDGPGPLALAASNARFEAEARIAAARGRGRSASFSDALDPAGSDVTAPSPLVQRPTGEELLLSDEERPRDDWERASDGNVASDRNRAPGGQNGSDGVRPPDAGKPAPQVPRPASGDADDSANGATLTFDSPADSAGHREQDAKPPGDARRDLSGQRPAKAAQSAGEQERQRGPFVQVQKSDKAVRIAKETDQGTDRQSSGRQGQPSGQANTRPAGPAQPAKQPERAKQPKRPEQAEDADQPEQPGQGDRPEPDQPGQDQPDRGQQGGQHPQANSRRGRIARSTASRAPDRAKHSGMASGG